SQLNPDGSTTYGQPLTTRELYDTAIARFDSAATVSTSAAMTNFASVEKARALIDRDTLDVAAAGALAGAVPTSFVYLSEHSENTDRESNGVYSGNTVDKRYSVAESEGTNGFPWRSVVDPRTPSERPLVGTPPAPAVGFDRTTPQWNSLRFGRRSSPITVATGVEARLIQAEAALRAGDTLPGGQFLTQLNEPRVNPGERAYLDPTGAAPPIGVLPDLTV